MDGARGATRPTQWFIANLRRHAGRALVLIAATLCLSCRTPIPFPPTDFSAPGWRLQQGQAIWRPGANRPELAGELLLATNLRGNFFVQFAKTPFVLATAEADDSGWQIEFGSGEYKRSGRGSPPARFVWFELPSALGGAALRRGWQFEWVTTNFWRLKHTRREETLEGSFFQ